MHILESATTAVGLNICASIVPQAVELVVMVKVVHMKPSFQIAVAVKRVIQEVAIFVIQLSQDANVLKQLTILMRKTRNAKLKMVKERQNMMIFAIRCRPRCTGSAISPAIWYALNTLVLPNTLVINANARVVSRMTPQDYAQHAKM